jgi:uncharacterized membrane protein (TIGR02234 family)
MVDMTTARRELSGAVLASAAAGGLALFSAGHRWAEVTSERPAPLPPVEFSLTGADAAPLVPAAGLVLLAAALALVAVRGAARLAVGLLVAVAGGVLVWAAVRASAGGLLDASADLPGVGRAPGLVTVDIVTVWPVVPGVAGVLAVLAGLLTVFRSRDWPAMGRRYERSPGDAVDRPAPAPPGSDEDRAQLAWRALDRGEDPTDPAPGGRG